MTQGAGTTVVSMLGCSIAESFPDSTWTEQGMGEQCVDGYPFFLAYDTIETLCPTSNRQGAPRYGSVGEVHLSLSIILKE